MKRLLTALSALLLLTAAPAFAATTSTSTPLLDLIERPTVTQSTYTVDENHVLVEAGYNNTSYSNNGGGTASAVTYPQALVRIGTQLKNLEVYFKAPSEVRIRATGSGNVSASDDVKAGAKYLFLRAPRYAVSAQLGVDVPTGTLGNTRTQTSFSLNGEYKITSIFSLKTTQTLTAQNFAGVSYGSYTPSFLLTATLPRETSVFGEYALSTKYYGPGTPSRSRFLLGAAHDISKRLAVDVEGTTSPSSNGVAKYTGLGAGAAYQF